MFSTNLPQTKLGRLIICTRFDLRPFCPNLADKGGVYRRFSKGGGVSKQAKNVSLSGVNTDTAVFFFVSLLS